ncbi:MAG TPA: ABC transporter permease [Gammaproteobacteria bacterium]|nr:ABC transporter permease [Gammaproteobacteria bacterium]
MSLRQTLRRLLMAPGFTLTTVLTLAIGIGATTAIFSVVNGVLLEPLPFPEPDRLVALTHRAPGLDDSISDASPAFYFTYRDNNRTFESVALWFASPVTVTGTGDPEEIQAVRATREFLPTLGVRPLLGRAFTEAEDQPGSPRTVMLSYPYWQRRFGGASDVLGKTLTIDGAPAEIVGVLPQAFRFLEQQADVLLPAQPYREGQYVPSFGERGIARLKEGVTLDEANADGVRMMPILFDTFPVVPGITRARLLDEWRLGPAFMPLKDRVVGDLDDVLWVLLGTIGLLLLIACANVANLELVRIEGRTQELAIRSALGASWRRIAGNVLLESTMLGIAGGALGLALAYVSLPMLLAVAEAQLPGTLQIAIDANVVWATLGISLASGFLSGLLPIVKHAAPRVAAALHGSSRLASAGRERHGARNALVIVQVALALVLLVASGLMIRTFQELRSVEPGIAAPDNVQTLRLSMPSTVVPGFSDVIRVQRAIEARLAAVPGVENVGYGNRLPLTGTGPNGPFGFDNAPEAPATALEFRYVSPNYLSALGAPLVAGRNFEWAEIDAGRRVAIISANAATAQFGSPAAAVGKRVRHGPDTPWMEIVGVAADVRHNGVDQPAPATIYMPQTEFLAQFMSRQAVFFVRSERAGTPGFVEDLQRAVRSLNAQLPLGSVQTLGEVYDRSLWRTSLTLVLLAITAGMALALGLVGIYGVISYVLAQRTREIGIRMALGAPNAALLSLILGRVLVLVGMGVALGLGGAAALTRLMRSLLFGVTALDPMTYAAVSAVLIATALLAGYLPARRVARVDPMQALRAE